jgi:hypothetical protein
MAAKAKNSQPEIRHPTMPFTGKLAYHTGTPDADAHLARLIEMNAAKMAACKSLDDFRAFADVLMEDVAVEYPRATVNKIVVGVFVEHVFKDVFEARGWRGRQVDDLVASLFGAP